MASASWVEILQYSKEKLIQRDIAAPGAAFDAVEQLQAALEAALVEVLSLKAALEHANHVIELTTTALRKAHTQRQELMDVVRPLVVVIQQWEGESA